MPEVAGCARCGYMTCGWNNATECEGMVNPNLVAERDYRANRSWIGRVWDRTPGLSINLGLGHRRSPPPRWRGRRK